MPGLKRRSSAVATGPARYPVPSVRFERLTGWCAPAASETGETFDGCVAASVRHGRACEGYLAGWGERTHVVFDAAADAGTRVVMAREAPELANTYFDLTGRNPGRIDAMVVVGPAIATWSMAAMEVTAMDDVVEHLGRLYPLDLVGPVEPLGRHAFAVAASVILGRDPATVPMHAAMARHGRMAMAATGMDVAGFARSHPAWAPMASAIGQEASAMASTLRGTPSYEAAAHLVHETVGRAMGRLGAKIVARTG